MTIIHALTPSFDKLSSIIVVHSETNNVSWVHTWTSAFDNSYTYITNVVLCQTHVTELVTVDVSSVILTQTNERIHTQKVSPVESRVILLYDDTVAYTRIVRLTSRPSLVRFTWVGYQGAIRPPQPAVRIVIPSYVERLWWRHHCSKTGRKKIDKWLNQENRLVKMLQFKELNQENKLNVRPWIIVSSYNSRLLNWYVRSSLPNIILLIY